MPSIFLRLEQSAQGLYRSEHLQQQQQQPQRDKQTTNNATNKQAKDFVPESFV
jgi:hypothetical protein